MYVDPENHRRFRHADGTPWVPFVIHADGLLNRDAGVAREWVNRHVALGVDAMSVSFHSKLEPNSARALLNLNIDPAGRVLTGRYTTFRPAGVESLNGPSGHRTERGARVWERFCQTTKPPLTTLDLTSQPGITTNAFWITRTNGDSSSPYGSE